MNKDNTHSIFIRDFKRPVYDLIVPTYILDSNFHIVDWNAAFDEICAKSLKLSLGMHASKFVLMWENGKESMQRATKVYSMGNMPFVDHEPAILKNERYGTIQFEKVASQIIDHHGVQKGWVVTYNICSAQQKGLLFDDITARVESELHWSVYAAAFEQLNPYVPGFTDALATIHDHVQESKTLCNLGAGSGIGLSKFLDKLHCDKIVVSEFNETMTEQLKKRLNKFKHAELLRIVPGHLPMYEEQSFDACFTYDGLYRAHDLNQTFGEIHRLLDRGGLFTFLTFHKDTDFPMLLKQTSDEVKRLQKFEKLHESIDALEKSFANLSQVVKTFSLQTIKQLLEKNNFRIETWDTKALAKQGLLVKAVKQ